MTAPRRYATAGALRAALEARLLDRARRDQVNQNLDLTVRTSGDNSAAALRERLRIAAGVQLPNFFMFVVDEAMAELNHAPEGGARFRVGRHS